MRSREVAGCVAIAVAGAASLGTIINPGESVSAKTSERVRVSGNGEVLTASFLLRSNGAIEHVTLQFDGPIQDFAVGVTLVSPDTGARFGVTPGKAGMPTYVCGDGHQPTPGGLSACPWSFQLAFANGSPTEREFSFVLEVTASRTGLGDPVWVDVERE